MDQGEAIRIASESMSQVIWTFSSDLCNALHEMGVPKDVLNQASKTVLEKYMQNGMKIKSAVTIRTKKEPKSTSNVSTASQILSIFSQKSNKGQYNWIQHPNNNEYLYTTEIKFHTDRHPVMHDNKLVGTIDNNGTYDLTKSEIGEAQIYGLI